MRNNLRVQEVGDELIIWDDEFLQADVLPVEINQAYPTGQGIS
jgi:hypothetical protein